MSEPYDDADIYAWNGATFSRTFDGSTAGLPNNADIDGLDVVSENLIYVSLNANNTSVPGLGDVQDEDVLSYSAGTWTVVFNGTARGLTAGNQDLDALDIVVP